MSGSSSGHDIFDVRKIRRLIQLMQEHDLAEIDLRQGDTRIQLRRGGEPGPAAPVRPAVPLPPGPPGLARVPQPPAPPGTAAEDQVAVIKSPMVGTFYSAPDPESPPFVQVGDPVGPDTIVCIVEAMKVFNEIPAEVSGRVVGVLVENGEPVEFGQPMFKVDTRQ
jgi:acetyl-CoA carboxylase biotin carboxyl carrier protein